MRQDRLLKAALICWLAALCCLLASLANAAPRKFVVASTALAALAAVDLAQSVPCVRVDAPCREVNPVYARLSPAPFIAVKAAGIGLVTATAWRLRARRPKTAWTILISMTAAQGFVVAHNARVK